MSPPVLSPLSEKAKYLIHYLKFRRELYHPIFLVKGVHSPHREFDQAWHNLEVDIITTELLPQDQQRVYHPVLLICSPHCEFDHACTM